MTAPLDIRGILAAWNDTGRELWASIPRDTPGRAVLLQQQREAQMADEIAKLRSTTARLTGDLRRVEGELVECRREVMTRGRMLADLRYARDRAEVGWAAAHALASEAIGRGWDDGTMRATLVGCAPDENNFRTRRSGGDGSVD